MLDIDACMLCAECLAGATGEPCSPADLRLTAVAFARDLADTGWSGEAALELLDAAHAEAIRRLDSSDLDGSRFADALRALAYLRAHARRELSRIADADREPVAGHE